MNREQILSEIQRTAAANGGSPLGVGRFATETGIKESDWRGKFWARWGDAVREAGLTPNVRQTRADDGMLLGRIAGLVREFGRYPTVAELKLRRRRDPTFPSHGAIERHGSRLRLVAQLAAFCESRSEWADVAAICKSLAAQSPAVAESSSGDSGPETGYVYLALMKVGRERRYKIGKANLVDQRARQVAVNLPEELELLHAVSTDDAYGIEAYWHRRFASKRRGGEWFALTAEDVRAFKRRRFM